MNKYLIIFFVVALLIRLFSLKISILNEKNLKQLGATEHGKFNSILIAVLHTLFYISCFVEGILTKSQISETTGISLIVYVFAIFSLFYVVHSLGPLWTVKLIIAPDHKLVENFIFKTFRHPNYFFNIIPELISFAVIFSAFNTLKFLFPIYLIVLFIRIFQEENIMRETFSDY